jgi:putative ABC transport system permease protein
MSAHRVAQRLARREMRRRPGRTALVVALVALPVAALVVGLTINRTSRLPNDLASRARLGNADATLTYQPGSDRVPAAIDQPDPPVRVGAAPAAIRRLVPGADVLALTTASGPLSSRLHPPIQVRVVAGPVDDPLVAPQFSVTDGRLPARAGEVAVGPEVAARLGTGVGEDVSIPDLGVEGRVVGLVHPFGSNETNEIVLHRMPDLASDQIATTYYIRLPDSVSRDAVTQLAGAPFGSAQQHPTFRADFANDLSGNLRATMFSALALEVGAFAVLGIVISVAFAIGARRQLRTLGLLAANGGSPKTLRTVVLYQGVWAGAGGASVGLVTGLIVLVVLWPFHHGWIGYDPTWWTLSLLDLAPVLVVAVVAAVISSYLPARTAGSVSVLHALAGRRPLRPVRARTAATGIGLAVVGPALLILPFASVVDPGFEVVGVLVTLAAAIVLAPVAVGLAGWLGARLSGVPRLSLRSLARQRTRFGSVVAAIAVSTAIAFAVAASFTTRPPPTWAPMPDNAVMVYAAPTQANNYQGQPLDPDQIRRIGQILGDVSSAEMRTLGATASSPSDPSQQFFTWGGLTPGAVEATPELIDTLRLTDDQRHALADTGAISIGVPGLTGVSLADQGNLRAPVPVVPFDSIPGARSPYRNGPPPGLPNVLVAPRIIEQRGIVGRGFQHLFIAPAAVTAEQRLQLDQLSPPATLRLAADAGTQTDTGPKLVVRLPDPPVQDHALQAELAAVGATALFAALVLAIGLALAAADSRDERDALDVLGAPPLLVGRINGLKAATLAFLGALVALPIGVVPVLAVVVAGRLQDTGTRPAASFGHPPWTTIIGLVVVAPVVMGLVTTVGSNVRVRFRPVAASRFAEEA